MKTVDRSNVLVVKRNISKTLYNAIFVVSCGVYSYSDSHTYAEFLAQNSTNESGERFHAIQDLQILDSAKKTYTLRTSIYHFEIYFYIKR